MIDIKHLNTILCFSVGVKRPDFAAAIEKQKTHGIASMQYHEYIEPTRIRAVIKA